MNSATDRFTEEEKCYELKKCAELPDVLSFYFKIIHKG